MNKTNFKKYFSCEPREEIEEKLLQFPSRCGVVYKEHLHMPQK